MRKKQAVTKDEAIILLQSQPLSASLWQLASDRLQDNAIRFPDPSFLDSQTWPDYLPKKQKNGFKTNSKPEKEVSVEEESIATSQYINKKPDVTISESSSSEHIQREEDNESITLEIIETQITEAPSKKIRSAPKVKAKKQTKVGIEELDSLDEITKDRVVSDENEKASGSFTESLDFYEWLEELKETNEPVTKKQKKIPKLTKASKEIADAKELAENSLKLGEEIVSETLARLLARQGHRDEAIEMYQKLILKYPEKGTTFAAALQKLKS